MDIFCIDGGWPPTMASAERFVTTAGALNETGGNTEFCCWAQILPTLRDHRPDDNAHTRAHTHYTHIFMHVQVNRSMCFIN